jgi:segregation and condensation protein B
MVGQMREVEHIEQGALAGVLESLLLVAADATPAKDLAQAAAATVQETVAALEELSRAYLDANRGIQLREVAGGWRLFTHPAYHDQVESFVLSWDKRKLSSAALETLAVIAYTQPVTREGVRAIRGVNSDGVINSLKDKGYVREAGKDARQAALFATTNAFLETFGLRTVKDLPPLEEFAPDEESRNFIRERLSGTAMVVPIDEAAADLDEEAELLGPASIEDADFELQEAAAPETGEMDGGDGGEDGSDE